MHVCPYEFPSLSNTHTFIAKRCLYVHKLVIHMCVHAYYAMLSSNFLSLSADFSRSPLASGVKLWHTHLKHLHIFCTEQMGCGPPYTTLLLTATIFPIQKSSTRKLKTFYSGYDTLHSNPFLHSLLSATLLLRYTIYITNTYTFIH